MTRRDALLLLLEVAREEAAADYTQTPGHRRWCVVNDAAARAALLGHGVHLTRIRRMAQTAYDEAWNGRE